MSEAVRIPLRLLGLALFLGSLVAVGTIVSVGPESIADQMGQECRHNDQLGPAQNCTWQDVLGILGALPYVCLVGAVLLIAMHPDWVGPGRPARTGGLRTGEVGSVRDRITTAGILAVIALVVVTFAGVFVYRAGYTAVTTVEVTKEILDKTERPSFERPDRRPAAAEAPRGLGRGSLLRARAFRSAMAELRRLAPSGARLSALRVAPDSLRAEAIAGGRVYDLRKPWDGKASVAATAAATEADEPMIAFSRVNHRVPQRLATGRPVDYVVLQDVVGLQWRAFLRGGGYVDVQN